jgi:hypothetical protein
MEFFYDENHIFQRSPEVQAISDEWSAIFTKHIKWPGPKEQIPDKQCFHESKNKVSSKPVNVLLIDTNTWYCATCAYTKVQEDIEPQACKENRIKRKELELKSLRNPDDEPRPWGWSDSRYIYSPDGSRIVNPALKNNKG